MYFFREVLLTVLFIVGSYFAYFFCKQKEKVSYRFFLWLGFLLCFFYWNSIRFFFLDLFVLLAYEEEKREDALFFSIFTLISSLWIPRAFFFSLLLFMSYEITFLFRKHRKTSDWFLIEKTFLTSLAYFSSSFVSFSSCFSFVVLIFLFSYLFLRFLPLLSMNLDSSLSFLENQLFKITHEIKNPLSVCKGYLDMLDVHEEEKVRRYLPIIQSEISRALTIMDDFMNLRSMSIEKDIMDLYLLVEDTSSTMCPFLEKEKVQLIVPKFRTELFILGDYDRLKQVLINLIKNAYEAHAETIRLETRRKGNYVMVDLIDNGDGISKEDMGKIGELFYTTKPKGSGVGVSLSKEIIRLHRGEVKYQSIEGKGTKVRITLPVEI